MRIFLTGATGYVGRALARRLRTDGHEVRALVRSTSKTEVLEEIGALTFPGDITDRASMRAGMSGADWVIHAAAELSLEVSDATIEGANIAGSENVASLAHKLGVGRFLSVSSMAGWGGSAPDGSLSDETSPPQLPFPTRYTATKYAGEQAIQAWAKRGLKVNTVFPSLVYGPPGKKDGANFILRQLMLGRFPALVGGDQKTSWVFLDDLVDGMVRVMDRAPAGRGFLFAGEVASVREIATKVHAAGGAAPPRVNLPLGLAKLGSALSTPWYSLRGRRPPIPREQLDSLSRHWAFSDARAQAELGWRKTPFDQALARTLSYLRSMQ
ncbi:MAG: NAD-dependent epimerase/dehydratase family protein [Acidobacteriota bacterium]